MSSVDEQWKQFIQSQTSFGFSLNGSNENGISPTKISRYKRPEKALSHETSSLLPEMPLAKMADLLRNACAEESTNPLTYSENDVGIEVARENGRSKFAKSASKNVDDGKTSYTSGCLEYYDESADELEVLCENGIFTESERRSKSEYLHTTATQAEYEDTCRPLNLEESANPLISPLVVPAENELYISTKTKVLFLNQEVDIKRVFWEIPVEEYWKPVNCVVKKQMKIVSKSPEEYAEIVEKLKKIPYYTENVIKQINNPTARRIKFKDERKITVGLSKKDIMNCRGKVKNAFYNCFAIIVRFRYEDAFREIHVKVFNTGKLEIPGVLNAEILDIMRGFILQLLQPYTETPIAFVEYNTDENVLINSNFNCGFYIHREKLFSILRSKKYGIETSYDPCIYPGIKCKYYFNNEIGFSNEQTGKITVEDRGQKMCELGNNKKYTEVSFMIFRTGSCLIVGNCSERILLFIFEFIKQLLIDEHPIISVPNDEGAIKVKKTKLRKKSINISSNYHTSISTA